jgi:hypothetical protein
MTATPAMRYPAAQLITDWFEPRTWIIAVNVLAGWHAGSIAGAGWGLLAVVFAAMLPMLVVKHGVRRGRLTDRHLGDRHQRIPVMVFAIGCVAVSLAILAAAGAPRAVIALNITMLGTVTFLTLITTAWKISIHCATASASIMILAITFGPALAAGYLLVALTSWSRIVLRDHTVAQVIAGIIAGAATALLYLALR